MSLPTSDGPAVSPSPDIVAHLSAGEPSPSQTEALAGLDVNGGVRVTKISATLIGVVAAALLAVVFLVFNAQNSERVTIRFLSRAGARWRSHATPNRGRRSSRDSAHARVNRNVRPPLR